MSISVNQFLWVNVNHCILTSWPITATRRISSNSSCVQEMLGLLKCCKNSFKCDIRFNVWRPPYPSQEDIPVWKRRLAPESNEATCGAVAQHASGTCMSSKQSGVPARNLILCLSQNWQWTRLPMVIKYLSIGRIFSFFFRLGDHFNH